MDGERFSSYAYSYLTKRPRLSSQNSQQSAFNSSSMSGDSTESDEMDRDSMAIGHAANEPTDEELLCWQERQLAKCIVDNTVNRVVESYLTFFEDDDVNGDIVGDAFPDFQDPFVPFFEPINDRRLEESAISSAIDGHGLQQHINHANAEHSATTSRSSTPSETSTPSQGASTSCSDANNPLTPSEPEMVDDAKDIATVALSGDSTSIKGNTLKQIDKITSSDAEQALAESIGSCGSTAATAMATTSTHDIGNCINDSEHFDFMEAAVAVAIQKKGLAPYSIQMSPKR